MQRALDALRRGHRIVLAGHHWEIQANGRRVGYVHWKTIEALLSSGQVRQEGLEIILTHD